MSALTDRLYADWCRANGSVQLGHRRLSTIRELEQAERLRAAWIEDARQLAMRQRAEIRMRSARSREPVAGNCEAICSSPNSVKSGADHERS